jgi:hypothetical protein
VASDTSESTRRLSGLKKSPLELDSFEISTLRFESQLFDPKVEPLKSQVLERLQHLGVSPSDVLEVLENAGGFNEGIWCLSGKSVQGTLVLKLVKRERRHPMLPTDVENLISIIQRRPTIINDHAVIFPIQIFHCVGPGDNWTHNLIVMRKAAGQGFDTTVARKCAHGQVASLMQDLESLGRLLAQIHAVYGMQHGDLQPSNVFHEEANGWFTLVDCGNMSPKPYVDDDDVQHLITGIGLITPHMGEDFQAEVRKNLETSYARESEAQRSQRVNDSSS